MTRWLGAIGGTVLLFGVVSTAQAPRPFPQPGQKPAPPPPTTQAAKPPPAPESSAVPTEATLGVPLYPSAQFITSYDAGRGQRFYLFGVNVPFADLVAYYRTALKTRGDVLFDTPPTHQFEIGRFREQTMAFPPSVTIKDYTFGGSGGYPNPKPEAQPPRFSTVIQIVPVPPGSEPVATRQLPVASHQSGTDN
jgi:hypothetical protein